MVIDDGSTQNLLTKIPDNPKIRYIKKRHGGVSSARNIGIKSAKNMWLAFLDSDDEWMEEKIEKQVEYHQKNEELLFSHTSEIWIKDGIEKVQKKHQQKLHSSDFRRAMSSCLISPSTVLVHKTLFEKIGLFDENLKTCEDYDLWLRVIRELKIGFLEKNLTIKHGHNNQLSKQYHSMDKNRIYALKKHLDSPYKKEVEEMIIKKYKILIEGAKKRGKVERVELFENELAIFQSSQH